MKTSTFHEFLFENNFTERCANLSLSHTKWLESIYQSYQDNEHRIFMFKMALFCLDYSKEHYQILFSKIETLSVEQQILMMSMFEENLISLHLYLKLAIQFSIHTELDIEKLYQLPLEYIQLLSDCFNLLEDHHILDGKIIHRLTMNNDEEFLFEIYETFKRLSFLGLLKSNIVHGLLFSGEVELNNEQMQFALILFIDINSKGQNGDFLIPYFNKINIENFDRAFKILLDLPLVVYNYPSFIIALFTMPYPDYFYEYFYLMESILKIKPDFDIAHFYIGNYEKIDVLTEGLEFLRLSECLDEVSFDWLCMQASPNYSAHLFVLLNQSLFLSFDTMQKAVEYENPYPLIRGISCLQNNDLFNEYHLNLMIDLNFPIQISDIIVMCHHRGIDLSELINVFQNKLLTSLFLDEFISAASILFDNAILSLQNLLFILKVDALENAAEIIVQAHNLDMDESCLMRILNHVHPNSMLKAHQYLLTQESSYEELNLILEHSSNPLMTIYFWEKLKSYEILHAEMVKKIPKHIALNIFEILLKDYKSCLNKDILLLLMELPESDVSCIQEDIPFLAESFLFLNQIQCYSWQNFNTLMRHPFGKNVLFFLKEHLTSNQMHQNDYLLLVASENSEIFNQALYELFWNRIPKKQFPIDKFKLLLNALPLENKFIPYIHSITHFLAFYMQENTFSNIQLYRLITNQMIMDFNAWLSANFNEYKVKNITSYFKHIMVHHAPLFSETNMSVREYLYFSYMLSAEMKIEPQKFFQHLYQSLESILQNAFKPKEVYYQHFDALTLWLHDKLLSVNPDYYHIFKGYHFFRIAYVNVLKKYFYSLEGQYAYFDLLSLIVSQQFISIWSMIASQVRDELSKIYPSITQSMFEYIQLNFLNLPIQLDGKILLDVICLNIFENKCCNEHPIDEVQSFIEVKNEMLTTCSQMRLSLSDEEMEKRIEANFILLIQEHPKFSCIHHRDFVTTEYTSAQVLGRSSGR